MYYYKTKKRPTVCPASPLRLYIHVVSITSPTGCGSSGFVMVMMYSCFCHINGKITINLFK